MDARTPCRLESAATANIIRKGDAWLVPSQSGKGRYTVCPDREDPHCTCPDHETRGVKCKHIFAVEYAIRRESHGDGHHGNRNGHGARDDPEDLSAELARIQRCADARKRILPRASARPMQWRHGI